MTPLIPVLMAGGTGTRLWPMSRENCPKQFLKLSGDRSLLQEAVLRMANQPDTTAPVVICGEAHRFIVAEQLREIGISDATILLEPQARDTAPAATAAALYVKERYGEQALAFIMSADHAIPDVAQFRRAAQLAMQTACAGHLVAFGIKPSRAETGYGYLRRGEAMGEGVHAVAAFVEKPDQARAQGFLEDGAHSWNGGLYLFEVASFLRELEIHEPALLGACITALAAARREPDFIRLDAAAFAKARAVSIDYALMEKTARIAMVELDAGWDDVGSWSYLATLPTDARGNHAQGDVMLEDADDMLIHAEHGLVAALGVRNLVVVSTRDAILVTTRERAQDVKSVVARLKSAGRSEATRHTLVQRPWGSYESVADGQRFQVKRIIVKPGAQLSMQMHHHRAEHWIVVRGTAKVTCGEREFLLTENQSTYIPLGYRHRLENPGLLPLELVEVQSGAYLGEDDIVRFDDMYGRVDAVDTRDALAPLRQDAPRTAMPTTSQRVRHGAAQ